MFQLSGCATGGSIRPSEENSISEWVPREQVLERMTHPTVRLQWQAYLAQAEKVAYFVYHTQPEFRLVQQYWL